MSKTLQTLEDLRQSADAAWLWDLARSRLVWANAAGIAAFGAQSLFDLIDRPFDAEEPGLADLATAKPAMARDEVGRLDLAFPSLGLTEAIPCDCRLHALTDGRDGVLTIWRKHVPAQKADSQNAFEDLPAASFAIAEDGRILFTNELARGLFDHKAITQLQQLLLPAGEGEGLLERLHQSRLVSTVSSFQSLYGQREARINLRRKSETGTIFALAVMEDVTERRELERQLGQAPQPAARPTETLAPAERQVFENLGRTISQAAGPSPVNAPLPAELSPNPLPPPQLKATSLPLPLAMALEKANSALAIAQDGQPIFVNKRLVQLLGHADATSAINHAAFWSALEDAPQRLGRMVLPKANGQMAEFVVSRHSLPWKSGAADQFAFEPLMADHSPEPVEQEPKAVAPLAKAPPAPVAVSAPVPAPVPPAKTNASTDELRAILDICADGIVTLDGAGTIQSFSAGAEAIFGFRSAEVIGNSFSDVLSQQGASIFSEYLAGLSGRGLASVFNDGREVTGIVKQGGEVPLFLTLGRINATSHSPTYCAVLRDITAFKRSEAELRSAKEAAESASRHKSEFLARASHELRTPLNAIMGFSEIMRMGRYGDIGNERYRGYLNDIHSSGTQLVSMINDLLDLSKIESGKLELNFTAVNLVDCFNEAQRLLQDQATRARVVIRKSFAADLPRVVADQQAMKQVLVNLLSNAIKYTDAGGQVIVSARLHGHGALALSMQDTGIGMGKAELAKAVQPFMRVETPGRERPGTGLGLPLTKALVEANRASFDISSEPGKGTLVEIIFPTTRVLAE